MQAITNIFSKSDFRKICNRLAKKDKRLAGIIKEYGYPPFWSRPATFQSLILFILEQQVSLASAYAAFTKLKARIGQITPTKILVLADKDLRACYFSRQKIIYARELALAIKHKKINLKKHKVMSDEAIRDEMIKVKGIGHWTIDVYLMHCLQRSDLFPLGDIALVKSMKEIFGLKQDIEKQKISEIAETWRPYRTIASMILWHSYIKKRNIKIQE